MNEIRKGFTLVELIVVIAIIAILSSVSIVGFTRYIENARLSNDNQAARQMTQLIQYDLVGSPDVSLDAHDVRTIITENSGDGFDFTPQSRDVLFLYVDEDKEVIVASVDELLAGTVLSSEQAAVLLDDRATPLDAAPLGPTPEEVFGSGAFVLSEDGSDLARVVSGIRNLAESTDLLSDFSGIEDLVGDDAKLLELITKFNPDNTMFVNNNRWVTTAKENAPVVMDQVIFANGITNVPAFDYAIHVAGVSSITLPKTVKTIETNSFAYFFETESINLDRVTDIAIESKAFSDEQVRASSIVENGFPDLDVMVYYTNPGEGIQTYTGGVLTIHEHTSIEFEISRLPRSEITGIHLYRRIIGNDMFYSFKVYTSRGLLGTIVIPVIVEVEEEIE